MSDNTKIEWADATWNPIRAWRNDASKDTGRWGLHCEKVSPGCKNCYAERMNGRMLPAWGTGLDYTVPNREKVEVFLDLSELAKPHSWRNPRRVFVESMSDLFGEWVPDEMIEEVFNAMGRDPRHTFQVLTKRAERMQEYANSPWRQMIKSCDLPLPNVWLGVSVEDRQRLPRIERLRNTPAALRFLSLEPLLEDLGDIDLTGIEWVICGGESGPGARPCNVKWIRSIVRQCQETGVPSFVKQLGACPVVDACRQYHWDFGEAIGRKARFSPVDKMHPSTGLWRVHFAERKGGDPEEWPQDLRVRELPKQ